MKPLSLQSVPVRTLRCAIMAAIMLSCVTACGPQDGDANRPPQRVVSVSKQINEFMYDIGAEDVIVARDLTSVYPSEITEKPSVGYHRALSAEGIISMRPTLFLTDGNVGPDAVLEQLRAVGIPILTLEPGRTVESAQNQLARLGEEFHHEHEADSVMAAWRTAMGSVAEDSARWAEDSTPRPRVLLMHFGQIANNYLAIKRGSIGDRVLMWAGGVNAIDSTGGMMRLTPELIAKAAPDVIIATDVGFDRVGSAEEFAQMPGVALTPAARSGRVYRIDESEIMYFSPRTPAAVRHMAELIHGSGR